MYLKVVYSLHLQKVLWLVVLGMGQLKNLRKDAQLFGESLSRVLISVKPGQYSHLLNHLREQNIIFTDLGQVTDSAMSIDRQNFGYISAWTDTYNNQLSEYIDQ